MGVMTKKPPVKIKDKFQSTLALMLLLAGSFLACVNLNATPLSLNGLATYSDLTKDYYVGALYLPAPESNGQKILNLNQRKLMKLLVTAKRWSARTWTQQWQGNIAINNHLVAGELQKSLKRFTTLLKSDLLAGDLIMVDYDPAMGTQIFINQQLMLTSSDMTLFNALLATWIGKLPPSREFKSRILSLATDTQTAAATQKLYTNVVPNERQNAIKHWLLTPDQIAQAKENERQKTRQLQFIKARLHAQKEAQKKAREAQAQHLKQVAKLQAAKTLLDKNRQKAKQLATKQAHERRKKYAHKKREKESKLEASYYRDLYVWQLRKSIRDKITYPAWAREFNQEGIVDVFFTVNAQGKVIDIEVDENKAPKLLIGEVVKSIKNTSGQVLPPKKLKGSHWKISVNHSFNFSSKEQTLLVPPSKPTHLSKVLKIGSINPHS